MSINGYSYRYSYWSIILWYEYENKQKNNIKIVNNTWYEYQLDTHTDTHIEFYTREKYSGMSIK